LRVLAFDHDISMFRDARKEEGLTAMPPKNPSYLVVFAGEQPARDPIMVDRTTARILELSDGTRTASEILDQLKCEDGLLEVDDNLDWIEALFVDGLVRLRHPEIDRIES
jgi:hypothetical protein